MSLFFIGGNEELRKMLRNLPRFAKSIKKVKIQIDSAQHIRNLILDQKIQQAVKFHEKDSSKETLYDLYSCKKMMDWYIENDRPTDASKILTIAMKSDTPTLEMIRNLMSAFLKSDDLTRAESCLSLLVKLNLRPDQDIYNTLLAKYFETGELRKAEEMIKLMKDEGYDVPVRDFERLITLYSVENPLKIDDVLFLMKRYKMALSSGVIEQVFQSYCDRRADSHIEKLFHRLKSEKLPISYNLALMLVESYSKKDVKKGLEWIKNVERAGVQLHYQLFKPIILQYYESQKGSSIEKLVKIMISKGVKLDVHVFNILLDMCQGNPLKTNQIIEMMKAQGVEGNSTTINQVKRCHDKVLSN